MKLRPGDPEQAGMNPEKLKLVEKEIIDYMNAGNTYAFIILAARHGIVCLHKVFGKVFHEADAPLPKADTIFPVSSITKIITAPAAAFVRPRHLHTEGRAGLSSLPTPILTCYG